MLLLLLLLLVVLLLLPLPLPMLLLLLFFPRRASPPEVRNRNGHCSFFHAQGRLLCIL